MGIQCLQTSQGYVFHIFVSLPNFASKHLATLLIFAGALSSRAGICFLFFLLIDKILVYICHFETWIKKW